MASVYEAVHSSNWTAINAAIASRAANSFVMFIDGCYDACDDDNKDNILAAIKNAAPSLFSSLAMGSVLSASGTFYLNTSSPYASSFSGKLDSIQGEYLHYFDHVPADNILYLTDGAAPPVSGSTDSAAGVFIPVSQSYDGNGACVFAILDASSFDDASNTCAGGCYSINKNKIKPAFLAAAAPGGSCGVPALITGSSASIPVAPKWVLALMIASLALFSAIWVTKRS